MAKKRSSGRLTILLALVATLSPILVLIAAFGARFGLIPNHTAWELLTWQAAWWLAFAGAASALGSVAAALSDLKGRGLMAVAALLISGATLGGFLYQRDRQSAAPPFDVTSDISDAPVFSSTIERQRRADGATGIYALGGPQDCIGLRTVRRQVAPGVAAWAMQQAGFTPLGAAAFRADGRRDSFWYGFTHDVAIRIRPGATDVRVSARYGAADGGEACRLAVRLVKALDTRPGQAGR